MLSCFSEIVNKSTHCQTGKKICEELVTCIEKRDVSVSILRRIYNEKEKVSKLCASVVNKSTQTLPPSDLADQKKISDRISELWQIQQDCLQKIQFLESAIELGKKISSDPFFHFRGLETVIAMFSDLKEAMATRKVHELLQDDMFWGELLPLVNPAKALQPLVKSVSLINVAKKIGGFTSNEGGDEKTALSDFHSLMMFLTTDAIEELQLQWNPVFDDAEKLTVEGMKNLLGALKDEKRLDEELGLLEEYFGQAFSADAKTYTKDLVKYPNVLEQVRHVIGMLRTFKLADAPNELVTVLLTFQTTLENSDVLGLVELHQSMQDVNQILSSFSERG